MNLLSLKFVDIPRRCPKAWELAVVLVTALACVYARGQSTVAAPAVAVPGTTAPVITSPAIPVPSVSVPVTPEGNSTLSTGRTGAQGSNTRTDTNANGDGNRSGRTDVLPEPQLSEFQQLVLATTGRRLPIFGESLFNSVPSTFAPVDNVPVGPGYILGPGDELELQLTGQLNEQYSLTVDRTGAIQVPGLGAVHVAGLPYGQVPSFLHRQLGRIYRNFDLNVNLGALRTIQVFVVGQARRPGTFSISSLSTLLNALFESGGPAPTGSVRDIQVRRGGQVIEHFDLYALLLRGDKSHDISLADGDVIFIPVVGPQVAIVGSVTTSAVYEFNGPTTIAQGLALAGGPSSVAAPASVRLERVYQQTMRSVEDVPSSAQNTSLLRNGDILSVSSILERFRDAVTLRGNVANPGRYVWHPGMHVADLIPNRESLITRNYWQRRNALGQAVLDYQPTGATAQPEGALVVSGTANGLSPAPNSTTAGNAPSLAANGRDPNSSANAAARSAPSAADAGGNALGAALTGSNSVFGARTDVVLSAPDIDWSYAVIERQDAKTLTTSLLPFNLGRLVLDGDASQNLELFPGDVITIFSKADLRVPTNQQTRYVRLEGEFNSAGVYSVLPGETLRGLLRRAGGFTPDAYLYASEFTRESTRRVEAQRLREYADQLEAQISAVTTSNQARASTAADASAALASAADARAAVARLRLLQPTGRIVLDMEPNSAGVDAVPDLALEDGDRFVVPRVPANVTVEGQVYSANAFVYQTGQRVLDYLKRAGGPDRQADRKRTFVLRADGSVVSRQYNNVDRAPIYPGDTVVVPPVLDKRDLFQRILSIAAIVGGLGTPLATIAILARQ